MNFIKLVRFDFMNIVRTPMLLFMNTLFPLLLFGGFGLATSSKFGGGTVSSYDYYGVTTMIFTAILISMTVTNTFMEEKVKRGNLRVVYAPVSKTEIYMSKLLSTYIFGTVSYSILLAVLQYVFHSNLGGRNLLQVMLLINILSLFGCSLGTMVCCIFKSEEKANAVMPILSLLFVFFGGIFSPIGHYGKTMQKIACLSPVKWVTECSFRIIYDSDFGIYLPTMAILLAGSALCILMCQIIFRPEE